MEVIAIQTIHLYNLYMYTRWFFLLETELKYIICTVLGTKTIADGIGLPVYKNEQSCETNTSYFICIVLFMFIVLHYYLLLNTNT